MAGAPTLEIIAGLRARYSAQPLGPFFNAKIYMMTKILAKIVIIGLLAATGFYVYGNYLTACSQTLAYSIGAVDPRFGISSDDFRNLAEQTESVWETEFDKDFFRYDPNAEFKINLVFDDRQQRTIDEKNSRQEISTQQQIYRSKVSAYDARLSAYQTANVNYDAAVAAYEQRLQQYNEQVDHWNKNGGAPAKEYAQLQREKSALQREASRLEGIRRELNSEVAQLNADAAEVNSLAKDLNLDVDAYNGAFGTTREFDQGSYTGSAINIYQFNAQDDLRLVLAHEYGHALGLDHVDDPNAIMYYLMDKQNIKNLHLSEADISAVKGTCHIR